MLSGRWNGCRVQAKRRSGCTRRGGAVDGRRRGKCDYRGCGERFGIDYQNYASGTVLTLSVQTGRGGCTTTATDANVTLPYRMQ